VYCGDPARGEGEAFGLKSHDILQRCQREIRVVRHQLAEGAAIERPDDGILIDAQTRGGKDEADWNKAVPRRRNNW